MTTDVYISGVLHKHTEQDDIPDDEYISGVAAVGLQSIVSYEKNYMRIAFRWSALRRQCLLKILT